MPRHICYDDGVKKTRRERISVKNRFSIILALILMLSLTVPAFAAETSPTATFAKGSPDIHAKFDAKNWGSSYATIKGEDIKKITNSCDLTDKFLTGWQGQDYDYPAGYEVNAYGRWDDDYLYFAFVEKNFTYAFDDANEKTPWVGHALQLSVGNQADHACMSFFKKSDGTLMVVDDNNAQYGGEYIVQGIDFTLVQDGSDVVFQIAIPWSFVKSGSVGQGNVIKGGWGFGMAPPYYGWGFSTIPLREKDVDGAPLLITLGAAAGSSSGSGSGSAKTGDAPLILIALGLAAVSAAGASLLKRKKFN